MCWRKRMARWTINHKQKIDRECLNPRAVGSHGNPKVDGTQSPTKLGRRKSPFSQSPLKVVMVMWHHSEQQYLLGPPGKLLFFPAKSTTILFLLPSYLEWRTDELSSHVTTIREVPIDHWGFRPGIVKPLNLYQWQHISRLPVWEKNNPYLLKALWWNCFFTGSWMLSSLI